MARPDLIETYLAELARRLPPPLVDELADGLDETYRCHRRRGLDAEHAAHAAIDEFGSPTIIAAAFLTTSSSRAAARALLLIGPVVGAAWAAAFLADDAWRGPLTLGARAGLGAAVVITAALLAVAAFGRHYRRATHSGAAACLLIIALDASMIGYISATGLLHSWPVPAAAALSTARGVFTLTRLPWLLTRR